jgi:hypothetical protein
MNRISIRQYLANYDNGDYKSPDHKTQCDAGWYDIFCKEETLHRKTVALTRRLKSIVKSKKIDIDTMYIFFKNNSPFGGKLYDDFRICDIATGDVIFTVIPKSGDRSSEGRSEVYGRENDFKEPLVSGTWEDVQRFFDVPVKTAKEKPKRKPKAKLLGANSNIFNLLGIAKDALRTGGQSDKCDELYQRVTHSHSYDEALGIITEYVDPV